jgi:hypothetical protein
MIKPNMNNKVMAAFIVVLTSFSAQASIIVEDFESGLTGFFAFSDAGAVNTTTTSAVPGDSVPGASLGNSVLEVEFAASGGFGGVAQDFVTTSNWGTYSSFNFWLYGTGLGNTLYVDIREDDGGVANCCDAEIWSVFFTDATFGWSLIEIPFAEFVYKTGAPSNGLGLTEVRGWAFGYDNLAVNTTYYIDDVSLIPEPSTLAIISLGLAGLVFSRRKRPNYVAKFSVVF